MAKSSTSFEKGHAPLEGCGRPLGSKTQNALLREYFRNACVDLFPEFLTVLKRIRDEDPKAYADVYIKMTERVIPKLASLQFEDSEGITTASEHLRQLAEWNKENKK